MIDEYSGLKYDSFEVIEDDLYGNWFNKFQMYDRVRDGENLYFDLDMIIYNKLPNLIRQNFTLLDDTWWRKPAHICPSIKDYLYYKPLSYIWDKFKKYDEFFITTYTRGSDEWYYKNIKYETFDRVCPSIKDYLYYKPLSYIWDKFKKYDEFFITTYTGWYSNYFFKH
jgi:hypothetical protein